MDSSQISKIKNYFYILYSRRYLFLFVSVTISLLIVVGSFFSTKKYEAQSTVFIETNVLDSLMRGLTVTPSMGDRLRVLRYYMLSRDLLLRVLKKLDMDVKLKSPEALEDLIKYCQANTNISLKGSDLFFVSIIDKDPQFAKDYINQLISTYVEENISQKREESFGANRFLSEQLEFYKKKLDKIEDEIYEFRKKTKIFSAVTESSIIEEIKKFEEEIKTLKFKKNELLATIKTIRMQLDLMESKGSSFVDTMQKPTRINDLKAQLKEQLLIYNDQYPSVIKLRELIAEMEKLQGEPQLQEEVLPTQKFNQSEDPVFVDLKTRMNTAQSDLNALQAHEGELLSQIEENKRILENFPQDKKFLADLERGRNMDKDVYENLLQRVGISEVSKHMEVADKSTTFRIVDPAILPTSPVGTKRLFKMLLGLVVGIGAGVAVVVALEALDDSVKSTDSLRSLGLAVLAEIPLIFDENVTRLARKKDKIIYSYSGICLLAIVAMIGHDLLGLTIIDHFIVDTRLDSLVSSLIDLVR